MGRERKRFCNIYTNVNRIWDTEYGWSWPKEGVQDENSKISCISNWENSSSIKLDWGYKRKKKKQVCLSRQMMELGFRRSICLRERWGIIRKNERKWGTFLKYLLYTRSCPSTFGCPCSSHMTSVAGITSHFYTCGVQSSEKFWQT